MKLYVAGPMTGRPQFNIPAFDAAAAALRAQGHIVVNPAEEDSPAVRAAALASKTGDAKDLNSTGETWGDLLARDVKIIADGIDGIVLLPGWQHSRGAKLEAFTAVVCRKAIHFWFPDAEQAEWISPIHIIAALHNACVEDILS